MRALGLLFAAVAFVSGMAISLGADAAATSTTLSYAVVRDGDRIGTSTITLRRDGNDTIAELVTHVQVKIAFVTVYRFEQNETEHWVGGKLVAMSSETNDNGTRHKVTAKRRGDKLAVEGDGKRSELDASVIPASLWNASLVGKTIALDTKDGTVTPVSVVDHGTEQLVLQGHATTAHHYSINTTFPQDVWYDEHHQLLRVELRGSDGSKIHYQLG